MPKPKPPQGITHHTHHSRGNDILPIAFIKSLSPVCEGKDRNLLNLPRCTPSWCWGCCIPRWGCSLRRTRSSGGSSSSARGRWSPAPRTSWSVPSGSAACTRRGPGSTHYQWVILTKHLYTDDEDRRLVSLSLILVRSNSLSLNSLSIELTAKYEKCEFDQTNFFLFFFQFWPGG